jgi:uncharacterized protein YtpQ (UPF0354 family)
MDPRQALAYLKVDVFDGDRAAGAAVPAAQMPIVRGFAGDLLVTYVMDLGDCYHLVAKSHLGASGLDRDELHRVGLDNLAALVNQRSTVVQPYGNIFAVLMGGDFEASLLLLDGLWDETFRRWVDGDYAVAVPARDILAFCDARSAAGIDELEQLIGRAFGGFDHQLSRRIYTGRPGRWEPR